MEALGDLWQSASGALYDLRVAIAVVSVVAIVALVIVARRRGWFEAARRHPWRSVMLTGIVLAIGLPFGWYLASPLIIRTELVEPAPVGAISTATAAAKSPEPSAPATARPEVSATPEPTPTPFGPTTLATGSFQGSDEFHFGRGTATIIEIEPGRYHLRLEDFSVRNGPDLFVYLSPAADGYAKGALELGRLKATDGAFGYDLPDGTDPRDFASAVIWCKQFAHLFATAPFVDG